MINDLDLLLTNNRFFPIPPRSSHSTPNPLSSANSSQDSLHRGQVRPGHPGGPSGVGSTAAGGVQQQQQQQHHHHPHHPYAVAQGNIQYAQMHGAYGGSAASGLHHHHHHLMHSNTGGNDRGICCCKRGINWTFCLLSLKSASLR